MHQEGDADERHHDAFLDELFRERLHRPVNQRRAIISDSVFDIRRETAHRLVEALLNFADDLSGIRAVAHHHDAADGFADAVQLCNTASHVRTELNIGDLAQQNGHAAGAHAHRHFF